MLRLAVFGALLSQLNAQAPAAAVSAADLAQYDLNKNGVLDPTEIAARDQKAKEAAILMNPFQVSTEKDRGYAAGNTLSGSRADAPLAITPASISVMTKEFMDDFAITDMNEAAAWTISMEPPNGGAGDPFGGGRFQASFRGGDSGANFPQRNGALQYYIADSYNSERFEFSRGPSTALFGDGGPGGIQGSTSKQARLNRTFGEATARADSFGGYRTTADYNYGKERWAVRVNLLHQNTKSFIDGTSNKQNSLSVAATYQIARSTQIRAEFERAAEWNVQFRRTYNDQSSFWNGTRVNEDNSIITGPGTFGLSQIANATTDFLVYNFGTNSLLNYKATATTSQYQTVGTSFPIPWAARTDLPGFGFPAGIDKKFFHGPADSIANRDLNARGVYLEHQFTPAWFAQLAYITSDVDPVQVNIGGGQGADRRIDINRLLPTGATNPFFGKVYSDTGGQGTQYQQDSVKEYRLTTSYVFSIPKLVDLKQRFSFNGGWRQGEFEHLTKSWRWANNPAQADLRNGVNSIRYRIYWDQPRPNLNPVLPPVVPGMTFREIRENNGSNARRTRTLSYGQIFSQTSLFGGREDGVQPVTLTGSFRRDKIVLNSYQAVGWIDDNTPILGFNGVAGATGKRVAYHNSESAGLVTYPFRQGNRWLSPLGFVLNYSSNFQQIPNNLTPTVSGGLAPLTQAETREWGLRYSMADGRVYMTLLHYDTDQKNVQSGWDNGELRTIYRNLGYPDDGALISPTGFNFLDFSDRKLEGWEIELTANPSRNLTFSINYGHPIVTTITDRTEQRAFFAANEAMFRAGAAAQPGQVLNGRTILDPIAIRDAIVGIENRFNGFTPGTLGNTERHRINVLGRYAFTEGKLKGLAFTGGVRYRGHKKAGSRDARLKFQTATPTQAQTNEAAYDYLWVDPTYLATAGINYTRRFGKYEARFQLNIENLLDDDSTLYDRYAVIQAGQMTGQGTNNALTVAGSNPRMQVLNANNNNSAIQPDPRKFTFTTTLRF